MNARLAATRQALPQAQQRGQLARMLASTMAARANAPTWQAYGAFRRALDARCQLEFGRPFYDVMRALHVGCARLELDATVDGIDLRNLGDAGVADLQPQDDVLQTLAVTPWSASLLHMQRHWVATARQFAVTLQIQFVIGRRPGFVVDAATRTGIITVVPGATLANWLGYLHECGHALVADVMPGIVPRSLDEAAAELFALQALRDALPLHLSEAALLPRLLAHRHAVAAQLHAVEAQPLPAATEAAGPDKVLPWPLWHDPGAQVCYQAAMVLVAHALAANQRLVDRASVAQWLGIHAVGSGQPAIGSGQLAL